MKAILYIGATLMVGASIYGFIDLKKTSHNKDFRNLYDGKEKAVNPQVEDQVTTKMETVKPAAVVKINTKTTSGIKSNKIVLNKHRKISTRKFSRAPLDEKYLKEETKREQKKEPGQIEKKEK